MTLDGVDQLHLGALLLHRVAADLDSGVQAACHSVVDLLRSSERAGRRDTLSIRQVSIALIGILWRRVRVSWLSSLSKTVTDPSNPATL